MKKEVYKAISMILLVCMLGAVAPGWSADANTEETCFVTKEQTPIRTEKGGTIWTHAFSEDGKTSYNSIPVLTEQCIYLVNKNVLYALDYNGTVLREKHLAAAMNSVCYLEYGEGRLWIPLSGGQMECVDAETFDSLWLSESFGGQSLSHVTYHAGAVYAGTTEVKSGNETDGVFYCLDAQTGSTRWVYRNETKRGGYYWGGSCAVGDRLYFAGDNGLLIEHDLTQDIVYSETILSESGKIRCDLQYEPSEQALYMVSTQGELCRYALSAQAGDDTAEPASDVVSAESSAKLSVWRLFPNSLAVNCTSTPTIVEGTLYVGGMADGMGYLCVWDLAAARMRYTVETGRGCEVKSTPLVSMGYGADKYIYYSYNHLPGGVYYIIDRAGSTSGRQYTLYEPAVAKQYCMTSIVAGSGGVLYYSNDSGTLFAVSEVEKSSDYVTPSPSATTNYPAGSSTPTVTKKPSGNKPSVIAAKPKKPRKVRVSKTKKGLRIRWKKGNGANKTFVYGKVGNGKWKKLAVTGKTSYLWKRNTRKKWQVRLRSGKRCQNRWIYSGYTKVIRNKK